MQAGDQEFRAIPAPAGGVELQTPLSVPASAPSPGRRPQVELDYPAGGNVHPWGVCTPWLVLQLECSLRATELLGLEKSSRILKSNLIPAPPWSPLIHCPKDHPQVFEHFQGWGLPSARPDHPSSQEIVPEIQPEFPLAWPCWGHLFVPRDWE